MSSTTSAADPPRWATAFAPASVANVAIGFDILGFSVGVLGDRVTVSRTETRGVTITDITGLAGALPMDPGQNTAGRALLAMQPGFGFAMRIDKGIPLGSGLGGFISGCYTNDLDMIRPSFEDVVIDPQRQALIPGFQAVRLAAMRREFGAASVSIDEWRVDISGDGASVIESG